MPAAALTGIIKGVKTLLVFLLACAAPARAGEALSGLNLPAPASVPPAAAPQKLGAISGDVRVLSLPEFLGGRRVWVYLPPGYAAQPARRYPVLYLQDGQNLFDAAASYSGEWGVDEACERLIRAGRVRPLVVVGVDNGGASRLAEYTPWPDPEHGGGAADAYLDALEQVLMPEIARRYRLLGGPRNTFIGGSSLGGLLSAYAGFSRPGTWGGALALSPSYWWAGEKFASWLEGRPRPPLKFFYQDMGTREGGEPQTHLRALGRVEALAAAAGFRDGVDFFSLTAPGHTHSEGAWRERFPAALELLLGQ
jgi:predicted alpha/beta superfamily hydrolase